MNTNTDSNINFDKAYLAQRLAEKFQKEYTPSNKKINRCFDYALYVFHQSVETISSQTNYTFFNEYIYHIIYNQCELYQKSIQDKVVIVKCEECKRFKAFHYITRFSEKYLKKTRSKLYKATKKLEQEFQQGIVITLTIDANRYPHPYTAKKAIQKAQNKLFTILRKKFMNFKYFSVVEFTDHCFPHLHIVMNISYLDVNWLRDLWNHKYNIGVQIFIDRIYRKHMKATHLSVFDYIWKYVVKGMVHDDNSNSRKSEKTLVMKWITRSRSFSTSRNMLDHGAMTNSNSNPKQCWIRIHESDARPTLHIHEWIYYASLPPDELESFLTYFDYEPCTARDVATIREYFPTYLFDDLLQPPT